MIVKAVRIGSNDRRGREVTINTAVAEDKKKAPELFEMVKALQTGGRAKYVQPNERLTRGGQTFLILEAT